MREVDLDTIPLADIDPDGEQHDREPEQNAGGETVPPQRAPSRLIKRVAPALIVALCFAHGAAIWFAFGGFAEFTNGWPLWRFDHPLYYHSALVTRAFLHDSWMTAGYDPSFMSGYAKSIVFPSSSTLPELIIALFGGQRPELAYKLYVLVSAASVPWLIALACAIWRLSARGAVITLLLSLIYIWTDFPISYVSSGMVPYFLGIPLALAATGVFARFLEQGGASTWLEAVVLMSLAFLVHLTTAMVSAPAAAVAYIATIVQARQTGSARPRAHSTTPSQSAPESVTIRRLTALRHLAVWMIPTIVLLANSFWWLPGIYLARTKGPSEFAFAHPEGPVSRLEHIVRNEAPIQCVLIAAGLPGFILIFRRNPILSWANLGFCAAGFGWGYVAGASRTFDLLQPGRHTYAFFIALALAAGVTLDEVLKRLRAGPKGFARLDRWAMLGAVLIGIRLIGFPGYSEFKVLSGWFTPIPFLSSRPTPRALWIVERVGKHLKPGERLLYEEGGFSIPDAPDPFLGGRLSGILPERTGVEVIGGPYLHASLTTNFTQFGEGKLCGKSDWTRQDFIRYAKLYGPSAILCWSPHARWFCEQNPDLVHILDDDGSVLLGRVIGFEGQFLEGSGRVEAKSGTLGLHDLAPGLDGTVVLRYHSVPYLRARPAVAIEQESRDDDPVPFIRLRPPPGTSDVELKLHLPVGRQ